MHGRFTGVWSALPLALGLAALTVAGCAGGSSGSSTPVTEPTVNGTAVLSVSTGSIPIPAAGGTSATFLTGPGAPADTIVTVTASTTAPANGVTPAAVRRTASGGSVPFYYVTFTVSASVPQSVFVSQVLTPASLSAGVTYYEEIDDTTTSPASRVQTSPPGTVAGGTVTFTPVWAAGTAFVPGHTYTAMFYDVPGSPSPTPSGSSAPTTAPSGGATPTPAPTFTATPSGSATPTPTPTPQPTTQSTAFTANVQQTVSIPPVSTISNGTVTLTFAGNTSATLNSVPGLPTGLASPTTSGVVFFALGITASPAASVTMSSCGTSCSQTIPLTLNPTLNVTSAAMGHTFYAAECNATGCPISPSDNVVVPRDASSIQLTPSSFQDITGFGATPTWIVFYYQ